MMKLKYKITLLLCSLLSVSLNSNAADNNFTVYGYGLLSCGKYIKLTESRSLAEQWVLGFVTAKNETIHHGKETNKYLDGLDYHSIQLYITNYCNLNPLSVMYDAANHLVYDLSNK